MSKLAIGNIFAIIIQKSTSFTNLLYRQQSLDTKRHGKLYKIGRKWKVFYRFQKFKGWLLSFIPWNWIGNFADYHYQFTNLLFIFHIHHLSGDFEKVLSGKQNHWYLFPFIMQIMETARGNNTINLYTRHFSK